MSTSPPGHDPARESHCSQVWCHSRRS